MLLSRIRVLFLMLRTVYKSHSNQKTNHTLWITSSPDSKSKMQPCPHFIGILNSNLLRITKQRDQEDHLFPRPLSQRHPHAFCISQPQYRRLFHPHFLQICFPSISKTAPQEQRPHKTNIYCKGTLKFACTSSMASSRTAPFMRRSFLLEFLRQC